MVRDQPEDHGIRAQIDGQALSLFIDYDRARLGQLSDDGKIEYFEKRFELVVLNPLEHMLSFNDKPYPVLIIWGNALMCAIEAAGHFLTPSVATNSQAFQTFVTSFMDAAWRERPQKPPSGIDYYWRWLWDSFRNGLAHGAYVKNGGFEKLGERLFVEVNGSLKVDTYQLDVDFRNGLEKMKKAVRKPDNYFRTTFLERFNWTYIQGEE
ncbi:MAG: hypothetical protein K1X74_20795 [Pirellulales bacterium]|nr:hypothetical protein [Pirellulales bacterium]